MQENHYFSLKRKILASMLITPLVPFVLAAVVAYEHFSISTKADAVSKMERIVEDHAGLVDTFLKERKADLGFVAEAYGYESLSDQKTLSQVFKILQKESNAFLDLGIFDQAGVHVAYHGPYELAGKLYSDSQWFNQVRKNGSYVSDIFKGFRKVPHFVIAIAQKDEDRTWVLRATIDPYLFTEVVEKVRMGKTGEAYILNQEGVFQTSRRSGGDLMELDPAAENLLTQHHGARSCILKDKNVSEYLYVTTWLPSQPWLLVARQETSDTFADLNQAGFWVLIIALVGGAMISFLAFYMSNRIIARIQQADQEKSQLNQQLVVAGRLAEIGEMSSGFAHEINNPLQIIRAESALIDTIIPDLKKRGELQESEDSRDMEDSLEQIKKQVDRCASITSAILKFARQKDLTPQTIDLCETLPEVTHMIARKAELDGVALSLQTEPPPIRVNADPAQLQQVLLNLINNAIYAMVDRHGTAGGGELKLDCNREGDKAVIRVKDNGGGISQENMEKIFTPFFSTKPVGKGTGLGLSICYGIIEKMGGNITVNSEPGVGTEFVITLPAAG
ncbi:histidine kinase [Desulfatibacillum aliphaticivorans]|uniref:histidine kinase n=1 Tax=Desulfatibacillum aliphaticivorans TaxID=218208 RepID=B8FIE8_DESAL|nr:sensor histidine kinase [Desulfatibacillum aliphaticivorans]ACL03938.1 histidine kinase [Desulfatibacillum aliphaticivorans]